MSLGSLVKTTQFQQLVFLPSWSDNDRKMMIFRINMLLALSRKIHLIKYWQRQNFVAEREQRSYFHIVAISILKMKNRKSQNGTLFEKSYFKFKIGRVEKVTIYFVNTLRMFSLPHTTQIKVGESTFEYNNRMLFYQN